MTFRDSSVSRNSSDSSDSIDSRDSCNFIDSIDSSDSSGSDYLTEHPEVSCEGEVGEKDVEAPAPARVAQPHLQAVNS